MRTITPTELKHWIDKGHPHVLIDVREPIEAQIASIGGKLIPTSQLVGREDEIPRDGDVVVHCRSGKRSADAIAYLSQHGYDNLINLEGGILAWSDQVDATVPKY